jgi:hypothetical protein
VASKPEKAPPTNAALQKLRRKIAGVSATAALLFLRVCDTKVLLIRPGRIL